MFFLTLCLLFIIRLRFPTGKSIAEIDKEQENLLMSFVNILKSQLLCIINFYKKTYFRIRHSFRRLYMSKRYMFIKKNCGQSNGKDPIIIIIIIIIVLWLIFLCSYSLWHIFPCKVYGIFFFVQSMAYFPLYNLCHIFLFIIYGILFFV